jgi:cytidine deaminase
MNPAFFVIPERSAVVFCLATPYPQQTMSVTPAELTNLSQAAEAAAHRAYAPYSRFFVGAAILLESGEVVTGCNVENASYRLTCCAEQTAIASAVAQFGPAIRLRAVVVANLNQSACQPCGACRQTIAEFAPPDATIVFPGAEGKASSCTLAELLPGAFVLNS